MSLDRLRQVAEDAHRSSSCATTYLATFDPPTVKALLDVAEAAEELTDSLRCFVYDDPPTESSAQDVDRALERLREVAS